ncbi:MAG: hypothetical protein HUJ78_05795, partial [Mogibacterium sp.]|nr:hypothetical protein [Mogibacterium sp.]
MRIKESGKSLIRLITVAVMAVLLVLPCATAFNLDTAYAAASDKKAAKKSEAQQQLAPPEIKAGSAIVFAASTSEDVYSYRAERKLQPGALTKLMTAMIVIDNMHSSKEYDMKVDVTADAAAKDPNLPAAGEQIKIEKLLEHMIVNN